MSARVVNRFSETLSLLLGLFVVVACEGKIIEGPRSTDSQTNWLRACQSDSECGGLTCLCGVCTTACGADDACSELSGAACVGASEPGAIARCGGSALSAPGLCLPRCEDVPCPEGQMCVASVCEPVPEAKARVKVDSQKRFQTMIGFGASMAYSEPEIVSHPQRATFYDDAFQGLGLDVLRLRNRFGAADDDLESARQIVTEAENRLGRTPTIILTSWSPPASLKANGEVTCGGNPGTCTLKKNDDGSYMYEEFGQYWRDSLDAYAAVGVVPDYIGIQNNTNWVPTAQEPGEACKFLPIEGTTTVTVNGVDVEVAYPGYAEALQATLDALQGLPVLPKILAPETSDFETVSEYTPDLDFSKVDALAHHLYGVDPEAVDTEALGRLGDFGAEYARPILQTEMQSDGYGTAVLIHHTLEVESGAAYLQSNLTGPQNTPTENRQALIGLGTNTYKLQDPYYAMQHYALYTGPGWIRVGTESKAPVLATSWVSPDDRELSIILVNSGNAELDVEVVPGRDYASSEIVRSVFNGVERAAQLGALSAQGLVTLPSRSIVTVHLSN